MQITLLKSKYSFTSSWGVKWKVYRRLMLYVKLFGVGTKYFSFSIEEKFELDNSSVYPYYFTKLKNYD